MKRATFDGEKVRLDLVISIHALVKRATIQRFAEFKKQLDFNPRPREEGDNSMVMGRQDYH